jgi:hypothetical protein
MCRVTAPGDDELQQAAPETARQLRAVLAALADPDDELTANGATRHRIEGAALALDLLAAHSSVEDAAARK